MAATDNDIARVERRHLLHLQKDGRACGRHMYDHEWADMDLNGFVVDCDLREVAQ